MSSAFWADVLVVFHAAYVGFVVFGQLAILLGILFRWKWVRNFWFRTVHLILIAIVAGEALCGVECPITVWERELRAAAGQPVSEASFMGRLFHNMLFYQGVDPSIFPKLHFGFGVLVLLTFILAPPRWPFSRRAKESRA